MITLPIKKYTYVLALSVSAIFFTSCQSDSNTHQPKGRVPAYHHVSGSKARLLPNGMAVAPRNAPPQVKRLIAACNSLVGKPYVWGGGHRSHIARGYDCSGSVSYALKEARLTLSTRLSGNFQGYGQSGPGEWVSIYARSGHVYMVVCGLRFDTSSAGSGGNKGPAWRAHGRSSSGFAVRHPIGF